MKKHTGTVFFCSAVLAVIAGGCVSVPHGPLMVNQVQPKAGEMVTLDQIFILADASGSVTSQGVFDQEKALLEAFVAAMPAGSYEAGLSSFAGVPSKDWVHQPLGPVDHAAMGASAASVELLGGRTPLARAINKAGEELAGKSKRGALLVFSDGNCCCMDRGLMDACRELAAAYQGELCIYTVRVGDCPCGDALLKKMSGAAGCGQNWIGSEVYSAAGIESMIRAIFFGPAPVEKKAPERLDSDKDGVYDDDDECPGTPLGAKVDARGCWVLDNLLFDTDCWKVKSQYDGLMDEVVTVLKKNPGVKIRVDGHTDSRASDAHNQTLSENRAKAVKEAIVARGIDAARVESAGFGESKPIAPNDTPQNMQLNRRVELTVIP